MIIIIDKTKSNYYPFENYKDLCITKKLELDDKTIEFQAPYALLKDKVELEGYIETEEDIFVIKEFEITDGKLARVFGQLNIEEIEGKAWVDFYQKSKTLSDMMTNKILSGTGWTLGTCEPTKRRTIEDVQGSSLDVISQCLSTFNCEIEFDTKRKRVNIYNERGEDRGVYFASAINLRELTVTKDSHDFATEIEPYGKDYLDIKSVNNGQKYISNYTYSTKRKRVVWQDDRYTNATNLKDDAQVKLNAMCKPKTSYEARVVDLAAISNKYSYLDYSIGDTITLIDEKTGTQEAQRITEITEYPDAPENNTVVIENKKGSLDDYIASSSRSVASVSDRVFKIENSSKILWEGAYYMNASQVIDLSENLISDQLTGIALVFSAYTVGSGANNYAWQSFLIPKLVVPLHSGAGWVFSPRRSGTLYYKYIYIEDDKLKGHDDNQKNNFSFMGQTVDNREIVLRYVIGV